MTNTASDESVGSRSLCWAKTVSPNDQTVEAEVSPQTATGWNEPSKLNRLLNPTLKSWRVSCRLENGDAKTHLGAIAT